MKNYFFTLISLTCAITLIFSACSSQKETIKETPPEDIYVFDELPEDDTPVVYEELPPASSGALSKYYIVQVGAFTTRDKAENFAAEAKAKLKHEVSINYSSEVNLFVVQLEPSFADRKDAEAKRNQLWKLKDFKDAWILTVTKN
jgi:cell division septation protein DedD